jgi:hypothetical protein
MYNYHLIMSVDTQILLHSLAQTFHSSLEIGVSEDTEEYMSNKKSEKNSQADKLYYTTYSLEVARCLSEYIPKITTFELNTGQKTNLEFDFKLVSKKVGNKYIAILKPSTLVNDIIPNRLMKICKYRKNSDVYGEYTTAYKEISDKIKDKIKSKGKYSELTEEFKQKKIYKPITKLVAETLRNKRKCAGFLYMHLFGETKRIVVRPCKKRFVVYDFGSEVSDLEITSFKLEVNGSDEIELTFSNGAKFNLTLRTNSTDIKDELSLKFHTNFVNIDELFAVKSSGVKSS